MCYWFIGGRILVFSSNLSTVGFGPVHVRDDAKLYNTPNEKNLLQPEKDTYVKLAEECIKSRVCVDLFFTIPLQRQVDITTLAPLSSLTGGDLNYFMPFDIAKHGEKLHYLIYRILTRTQGSEVMIKARTSTGITVTEYQGGFGVKEVADFEIASIDSDKTISF